MDLVSLSLETLSLLFIAAILAGAIDTIAGGGGLITLPALSDGAKNPVLLEAVAKAFQKQLN